MVTKRMIQNKQKDDFCHVFVITLIMCFLGGKEPVFIALFLSNLKSERMIVMPKSNVFFDQKS